MKIMVALADKPLRACARTSEKPVNRCAEIVVLTDRAINGPQPQSALGVTHLRVRKRLRLTNFNRWYDSTTGRWISDDPIGFTAGDPNLARYVGNQSTTYTDPDGLEEQWYPGGPGGMPSFAGRAGLLPAGASWYNPFTWFGDWGDAVDQEHDVVRDLNRTFGTNHTRLDTFTPKERSRIETALGQKIKWGGGAIKACEEELGTRHKVLNSSEISLYVAGTADAAAGGLVTLELAGVTAAGSVPVSQIPARVTAFLAARGREAAVVGSLTSTQIQNLINSSGDRVTTVFTRLSQSPLANRALYTSTNPKLCDQIQHTTGRTQLYVARIPYDLFERLRLEQAIRVEQTQMGGVIDKAYVISAEAMPLLQPYFQQTGGDGIP